MSIDWQDDRDIFGRMLVLTDNPIFNNLRNAIDNHDVDLSDALSWGQLKSKRWLVEKLEELDIPLGTIFLCAGWYGTLAAMLFQSKCSIGKIRSFDIDESCAEIADTINRKHVKNNYQFKASTLDIMNFEYSVAPAPSDGTIGNFYYNTIASNKVIKMKDKPDTFINTSCEHIENFTEWYDKIPDGRLVVLQSNNFFNVEEHVNCVRNPIEFASQSPMTDCLYTGVLELPKYNRFMRIGYK